MRNLLLPGGQSMCRGRKRDRITKEVKSRYWWDRTHTNYGNLLPKTVNQALWIDDKEMGTGDFWQTAIELEMKAIDYAFEHQYHYDDKMPVGYQHIDCHKIFDVKITLDRKARYVAGGGIRLNLQGYHVCEWRSMTWKC
jgi:hypothetical protein